MDQMLEGALVILGIFLFIGITSLISHRSMKRRRKIFIHEKFGKAPTPGEWNENVRTYYDVVGGGSADDITWNDLSMNEVFQRIDGCDTSVGQEVLYWKMRRNQMSSDERQLFERRVRTFARNEKERESLEYLLCDIGKSMSSYYIPSYMDAVEEYMLKNPWIYRVLQVLLGVSFLCFLFLRDDRAGLAFLGVCVVNLAAYIMIKMKHEVELSMLGTVISLLRNARQIARRKEIQVLFPNLKKALAGLNDVLRGDHILRILKAPGESGDIYGVIADYVLGITLWQITTYNKVMNRLRRNVEGYLEVYREIGELDVAVNTASFRKSLPWYCVPEYTEEKKLCMDELYHPLIDYPVANSLELEKSCLITGSNASGKSTFIKAVAVNAVLAQSLNTCAAKRFVLPSCEVITSMAVKDDLMAGESYFIREIRYLKRILDSLNEEQMILCSIDEILRGTNTGERIRASRAILDYLADKNCIALVATHDKELTELLSGTYVNYHFSEEIGENDIHFSYELIEGPATSQNAVKLLEFAGFPEEIIAESQKI